MVSLLKGADFNALLHSISEEKNVTDVSTKDCRVPYPIITPGAKQQRRPRAAAKEGLFTETNYTMTDLTVTFQLHQDCCRREYSALRRLQSLVCVAEDRRGRGGAWIACQRG